MALTLDGSALIRSSEIADGVVAPADLAQPFTQMSAQQLNSGTNKTWTGIPSWARRITLVFTACSFSSTDHVKVQLGLGGSYYSSTYASSAQLVYGGVASYNVTATDSIIMYDATAANNIGGYVEITNISGNLWVATGTYFFENSTVYGGYLTSSMSFTGAVDCLKLYGSAGGSFDNANGYANVYYE